MFKKLTENFGVEKQEREIDVMVTKRRKMGAKKKMYVIQKAITI